MRKVKKPVVRPKAKSKSKGTVKRSPIARALQLATAKYEKAVTDLDRYEEKANKLRSELPRLEEMKVVLENYLSGGGVPTVRLARVVPPGVAPGGKKIPEPKPAGPLPTNALAAVPAHLMHMIQEHPAIDRGSIGQARGMVQNVNVDPANEDGFLPEPEGIALIDD